MSVNVQIISSSMTKQWFVSSISWPFPWKAHDAESSHHACGNTSPFPVLISRWSGIFTRTVFYTVVMTGSLYSTQSFIIFTKCKNNICIVQEWMNVFFPPFTSSFGLCPPVLWCSFLQPFLGPLLSFMPTKRDKLFVINYIPQLSPSSTVREPVDISYQN